MCTRSTGVEELTAAVPLVKANVCVTSLKRTLENSFQVKYTESVNLKNHHNPSLVSKSQSPKDETA